MTQTKLGEIAKVRNGYAFQSSDFQQLGVPIIRMSDLGEDSVDISKAARVSPEFLKSHNNFLISRNDIIVGMSGSIGKTSVYKSPQPALQNQRVGVYQINEDKVDRQYFKFVTITIEKKLLELGKGGTVKNISSNDIENLPLYLPPLDEQRRIAGILDAADKLRRLRRAAREQSDAFLQSAFLDMYTETAKTKIRFEDLAESKKNSFVNGPFGSDLLTSELTTSGVPVIYIRDIKTGLYKRESDSFVTQNKADELHFCKVSPNDVLIAKVGDPPGKAAIYPSKEPVGVVTQDVIRIRTDASLVTPEYLVTFLNSMYGEKVLFPIIVEGTRARIGLTSLKDILIPVPALEIQKKFSNVYKRHSVLFSQETEAERQAELNFQALLYQAFTGQLSKSEALA